MAQEAHKTKSEFVQTWVQIVVVAGAFLWGVYTFVYQQTIVPRSLPPYLALTSSLQKVGEDSSLIAIKGKIRAKNMNKTRVWVVASWYNAFGLRVVPIELDDQQFNQFASGFLAEPTAEFPRHFVIPAFTTVFASKLMDGFWFDPDDEWEDEFHFYVPRGRYNLIQLLVDLNVARDNRLTGVKWRLGPDEGNKEDLTPPGVLWAQICKKPSESEKDLSRCAVVDSEKRPEQRKFEEKYALSHTSSRSELSLLEPAVAKRRTPSQ